MSQEKPEPTPPPDSKSHLKPLRMRGSIVKWSIAGTVLTLLGLLLLTGMSPTPWLFLLYPLLIAGLLLSLGALALHLLHRF